MGFFGFGMCWLLLFMNGGLLNGYGCLFNGMLLNGMGLNLCVFLRWGLMEGMDLEEFSYLVVYDDIFEGSENGYFGILL